MPKRSIKDKSDLNQDNSNNVEQLKEARNIILISENELKKPKIIEARQTASDADSGTGSGSGSVLCGFKGFPGAKPDNFLVNASTFAFTDPKKEISEYAANVKALNQSIVDWMAGKVKENPLCNLTPIFKDYEKYLSEIEANRGKM